MRTPRTVAAANRLYHQAQAMLRRIPAGEKQRVRARVVEMTTAALRQAARQNGRTLPPPTGRAGLRRAGRNA